MKHFAVSHLQLQIRMWHLVNAKHDEVNCTDVVSTKTACYAFGDLSPVLICLFSCFI